MKQIPTWFLLPTVLVILAFAVLSCSKSKNTISDADKLLKLDDSLWTTSTNNKTGIFSTTDLNKANEKYKEALEIYESMLDKNDPKILKCLAQMLREALLLYHNSKETDINLS